MCPIFKAIFTHVSIWCRLLSHITYFHSAYFGFCFVSFRISFSSLMGSIKARNTSITILQRLPNKCTCHVSSNKPMTVNYFRVKKLKNSPLNSEMPIKWSKYFSSTPGDKIEEKKKYVHLQVRKDDKVIFSNRWNAKC